MKSTPLLHKKFSIGISFYRMTSEDWINVLRKYQLYIGDIFFSPTESIRFQTRRNIYNYDTQDIYFLEKELSKVLYAAKELDINRKIVLNVPSFYDNAEELVSLYVKYKYKYNIEYVTTFLSCAKRIKEIDSTQKIICSYNQGIKTHQELKVIIDSHIFESIVLGTNFFRKIDVFQFMCDYKQKVELLLNNGCMQNCISFCKFPNEYCKCNFREQLSQKNINTLYAECSMFPEEVHQYLLPLKIIDCYKLSTRPIHYSSMIDMLDSYIEGNSEKYISSKTNNYNLYGRLAHFHPYYNDLDYKTIISQKEAIWREVLK